MANRMLYADNEKVETVLKILKKSKVKTQIILDCIDSLKLEFSTEKEKAQFLKEIASLVLNHKKMKFYKILQEYVPHNRKIIKTPRDLMNILQLARDVYEKRMVFNLAINNVKGFEMKTSSQESQA